MPSDDTCRCGIVYAGTTPTGSRNWNPDCPVHPWNDHLQAQADRAVEAQRRAAAARRAARLLDTDTVAALADYLTSQGLAETLPGYGHATGAQVAEAVAAFLTERWARG